MKKNLKHLLSKPAPLVAKKLLGMRIGTSIKGRTTSGMIVEVEAYTGKDDPASHAYKGPSKRSEVMFRSGGGCYVYLIYGIHYCLNIVTGEKDSGEAVLIRAIEPLEGFDLMRLRRSVTSDRNLTNGPGKLSQSLGVDLKFNGSSICGVKGVLLEPYKSVDNSQIKCSPRIGISKAQNYLWRFYIQGNDWVSGV